MWRQDWPTPPEGMEELYMWRVYTRCWQDAGLRSPGLWIIQWMKDDGDDIIYREAVFWYINECKE